jgi:hypothetical protein
MPTPRRHHVVSFRVTDDEFARLEQKRDAMKKWSTAGEWCRAAALHVAGAGPAEIPPPAKPRRQPARRMPRLDTALLAQLLGQVGKVGSNINQLAHHANGGGDLPASSTLDTMADEIVALRAALTAALAGGDGGDN